MKQTASIRDYDWWLLAIAFAICGMGLLEIWSATHASHLAGMQWKQAWWIALGFAGMLLLSRLDYHAKCSIKAPCSLPNRFDDACRRAGAPGHAIRCPGVGFPFQAWASFSRCQN